jgi:hypothetical protein
VAQFPRQSSRPLTARSYQAAARRLREIAVQLERYAAAEQPREKAALTRAVHGLTQMARVLSRRHRGLPGYAPDAD